MKTVKELTDISQEAFELINKKTNTPSEIVCVFALLDYLGKESLNTLREMKISEIRGVKP